MPDGQSERLFEKEGPRRQRGGFNPASVEDDLDATDFRKDKSDEEKTEGEESEE